MRAPAHLRACLRARRCAVHLPRYNLSISRYLIYYNCRQTWQAHLNYPLKKLRRMREVAAAAVPATDILGEVFGKR